MLLSIPELEPKLNVPKEENVARMKMDFLKMQNPEEKLTDLQQLEQDIQESIEERKNAGEVTHFSENCLSVLQIQVGAFQDYLKFAQEINPNVSEEQAQQSSNDNDMAGMAIPSNRNKESKKSSTKRDEMSSTNRARESRRKRLKNSMG